MSPWIQYVSIEASAKLLLRASDGDLNFITVTDEMFILNIQRKEMHEPLVL